MEQTTDANGTTRWWIDGVLHREDAPAVECADGTKQWYLGGVQLSAQDHASRMTRARELTRTEIETILRNCSTMIY